MKPHHRMELVAWTLVLAAAFCFLASCATRPEEIKPAEVVVKTRRSNGTLDTPDTSPWGNPVTTKRWEFTDSEGRKFYAAEVFTVKQTAKASPPAAAVIDHAEATEIPKLTD